MQGEGTFFTRYLRYISAKRGHPSIRDKYSVMSPDSNFSQANIRLSTIKNQIMEGSNPTVFHDGVVPQAPEDPLFGLMAAYRKDSFEDKVDLGIGAYRDNNAQPWVLPVVKKVVVMYQHKDQIHKSIRPRKYFAGTPSSIMNICQSLVSSTSPMQHRNSS